jgi:hypothetical protein
LFDVNVRELLRDRLSDGPRARAVTSPAALCEKVVCEREREKKREKEKFLFFLFLFLFPLRVLSYVNNLDLNHSVGEQLETIKGEIECERNSLFVVFLVGAEAAARAAQKEARGQIKADRKALIQKVIDAKKERKANRRVILVDFKKLLGEVADLKKAAKEVDPAAEVDTTPTPATKKRATSAFLIATCEKDDDACLAALNNVVSGFVANEADVTMTETSDAELNEAEVENPETPKDKTNSASSLLLGFAGAIVAVASMF